VEYTVNKLAGLSGISSRTLRFYDQIDLLKPARVSSNGYRVYGQNEVDTLQQILFYRELGFALEEIKSLLNTPDFDREKSLQNHLTALLTKKSRIEALITNVTKTIGSLNGEAIMSDKEKFEGFKQNLIAGNEAKYGKEIREKYGGTTIDASNAKVNGMSQRDRLEGLAFSFLTALDGGASLTPYFLAPIIDDDGTVGEDIAGCLHEMFHKKEILQPVTMKGKRNK